MSNMKRRMHFFLPGVFLIISPFLFGQETKPDETPVVNMRYESWRLSRTGDTVVYKPKAGETGPDRIEKKLLDATLGRFRIQVRTYRGENLLEEKTEDYSIRDKKKTLLPSALAKEGTRLEPVREMFKGTVYYCQKYSNPDGSVEIVSQKLPMGGLLKKMNPEGNVVMELVEFWEGRRESTTISQIKEEKIVSRDSNKTALTVSELMKGIRRERRENSRQNSGRKRIVIGNVGKRPVKENAAPGFLDEVKQKGAKPTEQFISDSALLVAGFSRLNATAVYHLTEKRLPPSEGEGPVIPRKVEMIYQKYIPKSGDKPPRAVFEISSREQKEKIEIELGINPFPEMKAFELPPEAVTIIPGSFNCFHIRLVSPEPVIDVEQGEKERVVKIADTKIDFWISNVEGFLVVVKKLETTREQINRTSLEGGDPVSEEIVLEKKWVLSDFQPPSL